MGQDTGIYRLKNLSYLKRGFVASFFFFFCGGGDGVGITRESSASSNYKTWMSERE